jgi:excisionase family DNA binding protein
MKKTQNENRKPPRPPTLDLYTVAETAAILNVSQKTVFEWIKNESLIAIRLGPGQRLIRVRCIDLEKFIQTNFGKEQLGK